MKRAALLLLCLAAIPAQARADTPPNAWDIAKDPAARDLWDLHARVSQLLAGPRLPNHMSEVRELQARALLQAANAATSKDVRLRFDLGRVYEALRLHREAIAVLQPAVDEYPDHPAVSNALLALAYAYAKLDQPKGEREAYKRFLAKDTTESSRATATLNLAEAEMRLGNLPDAIAGYREAVAISMELPNTMGGSLTAILGMWGLSVALDRSGDPVGAANETKLANQLDPGQRIIGDDRSDAVFFEPKHERFWYTALGAQEEARAAVDPRLAMLQWRAASERWNGYVRGAEATDPTDRWLPLARAHLAAAKKALAAAEKRAAKSPRRPPALIEVDE